MLRTLRILLAAVLLCTVQTTALAMASKSKGLTMLVVPARYSVMQVAFDLLQRRDAVLLAYQGEAHTQEPLLHAWNGQEWVYVPMNRYTDASFIQVTPTRVVFVGDDAMVPTSLIEGSAWCPLAMSIPSVDTPSLVNSLGKLFAFRRADWQWFAGRYNLELTDLNADRRRTSWYDRPYVSPTSWRSYPYSDDSYVTGDAYSVTETSDTEYSATESIPAAEVTYEEPEASAVEPTATAPNPVGEEPAEDLDAPEMPIDLEPAPAAPAEEELPEPESRLDVLPAPEAPMPMAEAEVRETSKASSALAIEPVIDISRP